MATAAVSPGDITFMQGIYGVKPVLPAVPGIDGVGVVQKVGSRVKDFAPGDRVVLDSMSYGTWCTYSVFSSKNLIKVRNDIDFLELSVTSNPLTAYRMLKDYIPLRPGDTVIQNGGNSSVGQYVIQLCKIWGINTINVVRNRPDINRLKDHLFTMGATYVVTDQEIRNFEPNDIPRPMLALNCIGGLMAKILLHILPTNAVFVTYGSMAKEPVPATVSALLFKDIAFRGFWLPNWYKKYRNNVHEMMLNEVLNYIKERRLVAPPHYHLLPLKDYRIAINNTLTTQNSLAKKYVFDMRD